MELLDKCGLALRKHNYLAEDLYLQNPLEMALEKDDCYKSFELLFDYFFKNEEGNQSFAYQIVMRNLTSLMAKPELE